MRTTRIVSLLAATALSAAALAMPFAPATAAGKPTTCSQQERQVERAEAKLADLTALFAAQKKKAASTTGSEQSQEQAAEKAERTKKAKKAQVQRLAKAEDRLASCTEAQTTAG